jgi:hypothetical protein
MDKKEFEKFKRDYALKTLVQEAQFGQWLRFFFYLNHKLNEEYDTIYQMSYYVKLYELLTEGLEYAKMVLSNLSIEISKGKVDWYNILIEGLSEIKVQMSDEEFEFLEYKRHSASHIFQNKYEVSIKKDGKRKTTYKNGETLDDIADKFKELLIKHGSDKHFDIYLTSKLYPMISSLHSTLQKNGA